MIIEDRNDTELYTDAVVALTRAALERNVDGTPCDFGDFLAQVLAATAANVGGPDCLIAGRPGSWDRPTSTASSGERWATFPSTGPGSGPSRS